MGTALLEIEDSRVFFPAVLQVVSLSDEAFLLDSELELALLHTNPMQRVARNATTKYGTQ